MANMNTGKLQGPKSQPQTLCALVRCCLSILHEHVEPVFSAEHMSNGGQALSTLICGLGPMRYLESADLHLVRLMFDLGTYIGKIT